MTLTVNGQECTAEVRPLPHHKLGLSFTKSGYGRRIPTTRMVRYGGRWRRVYCCIFSNSGTCYIDGPGFTPNGRREWLVVNG